MTDPLHRTRREDFDHLQKIIASTYQIAGAYDAPEHILDVLANPLGATDAQVNALLPFSVPRPVQLPKRVVTLIERLRHTASKGVSVWGDLQIEAARELEILTSEVEIYASAMDRMTSAAAAAAAQPALKDGEIAKVVNALRDVALEFYGAQQLRERIAHIVVPLMKAAQPALKDGEIAELSSAIQELIAESTKGDDQEWREFAEEMALQYGFTYADDGATTLQARAVDLVNMMAVIGYRKGAQPATTGPISETLRGAILGAIARGWCHEKNASKTMDPDLAVAIGEEIKALIAQPVSNIAFLYEELRKATDGGSESMTHDDALAQIKYWSDMAAIAQPTSAEIMRPTLANGFKPKGFTMNDKIIATQIIAIKPVPNSIIFNSIQSGDEMLKIAPDGFYVRGVKIQQDEHEANAVYAAFVLWMQTAEARK